MQQDRWQVVLQVYEAAVELPETERFTLLESASPDIRQAVIALLESLEEPVDSSRPFSSEKSGPPAQVGHYTVLEQLGSGGMGAVYSARDTKLDRLIALKFLNPDKLGAGALKRLVQEAKAASALNHPNIVTVHEVIESESDLAIVMELVDGVALRSILGAPTPFPKLVRIGRQVTEALAAAHARDIIHRDIKPENIMVREDGYVKLLDFGLAQRAGAGQGSDNAMTAGTLRYMSPEQARGGELTTATDVFSLGIILYECATGQHPFYGESPFETAHRILTEEPPAPSTIEPGISFDLEHLIVAMLSKDAQARPSAQIVLQELNAMATRESLTADSHLQARASWRGKKWIAAAVLLVACGLAAWYWQKQVSKPAITFHRITTQIPENRVLAAAISGDGKRLAYANVDGIFLRVLATSETQPLRNPDNFSVDKLAWLSDGVRLVVGGFFNNTHRPSIWSVSIRNAEPRLIREAACQPEPSPDGTKIAFTNCDRTEIWIAGATGADARRLVSSQNQDRFSALLWSADGSSLRYQRRPDDPRQPEAGPFLNTQQRTAEHSYESVDVKSGRQLFRVRDMSIHSAFALPDGRVLCLRPVIHHPGWHFELWELKTDIRTGRLLHARLKISLPNETWYSSLTATFNGEQAVLVRASGPHTIYLGDYSSAGPRITNVRRFTLVDENSTFPHAWTPDSRSLIFESARGAKTDLFKQKVDSRIAETILATPRQDEVFGVVAPGGKWLLFTQGASSIYGISTQTNPLRLMRMPLEGGTPEPVPVEGPAQEYSCAAPHGVRCVLRTSEPGKFLVYYELDPVHGKGRELARTRWTKAVYGDWDISPDGTEVALPIHDSTQTKLRIVSLEGRPEREILLKGFGEINGLNWTADGKGWFVVFNTTVGQQLMYVDRNGNAVYLLDGGYALNSPDGRKVALVLPSIASNAWMYEGL